MYKELHDDLGCYIPNNGYLEKWTSEANSHRDIGWEIFTDKIISLLKDRTDPVIFILWGNNAISKEKLITNKWHYIIKSVHPSPLSAFRGFFGSKPFSKTNNFLKSIEKEPIDWQIENI
jgi:uracil-DNA glycosylase